MERASSDGSIAFIREATSNVRRLAGGGGPKTSDQKSRFGTYYPRLFAYVYSLIEDEAKARDVVSEAFSRVLARTDKASDDEFVVELFRTSSEMVRASAGNNFTRGTLTSHERELLAFLFDARLTRDQISRLTCTTDGTLSAALLGALRKLQAEIGATVVSAARPA